MAVPLSGRTRAEMAQVLAGTLPGVQVLALNASDPRGEEPDAGGPAGLYPLVWRVRGEQCVVRLGFDGDGGKGEGGGTVPGNGSSWTKALVGCFLSLHSAHAGERWWRLSCDVVSPDGRPVDGVRQGRAVCPKSTSGLRLVAVLERVQSGLLGATLSSFGITGLYITFVYGIGRFLRLWLTNIRLKIPYEDFASTKRLVALCQDIYIARAEGELALEEELFYLLLKIYKTPAVLLEMTRRDKEH